MWSRFGQVAGKLRTSVTEFAADVLDTAEELSHQVERSQNSGSEQLSASRAAPEQPKADAMRERLAVLRSRMAAERSGRGCAAGKSLVRDTALRWMTHVYDILVCCLTGTRQRISACWVTRTMRDATAQVGFSA